MSNDVPTSCPPKLAEQVLDWLHYDHNSTTREEILELCHAEDYAELENRLGTRIEFGTAGLRGRMEAGTSRMNDLTVIQASQGLCAHILRVFPNAATRGLIVGYDHRHHSERWAKLTAAIFVRKGVKVMLYEGTVHTPLVPFAVKRLDAVCGVMITASHNPKQDNGYKVYWSNAIQIIPPHDGLIAAAILQNLPPTLWEPGNIRESPLCEDRTDEMKRAYFEHLATLSRTRSNNSSGALKFVHTAMHGVATPFLLQAFEAFGYPAPELCPEQKDPDPEFPTVVFPNPEEKGALDLAMKHADSVGGQIVIANDPDGDRFTAAERAEDSWTVFTGDQIGTLFAAWVLQGYKNSGEPADRLAMVASTVSSKMIASMARLEGFKFEDSLTGFKYIGNAAEQLDKEGFAVPFAYEEAIGFMLSQEIRDKDGITAAACFAELCGSVYTRGSTLKAYLAELYEKYGTFVTRNSYFICRDPKVIEQIFHRLRYTYSGEPDLAVPSLPRGLKPLSPPKTLGGLRITGIRDLTLGYDSTLPPKFEPRLPNSGGEMITWTAGETGGEQVVLTIRTSGTEPKIKYYLEGSGPSAARVDEILTRVVSELRGDWMEADKHGLGSP